MAYNAITLLSEISSIHLLAAARRLYARLKDARDSEVWNLKTKAKLRAEEKQIIERQWEIYFNHFTKKVAKLIKANRDAANSLKGS